MKVWRRTQNQEEWKTVTAPHPEKAKGGMSKPGQSWSCEKLSNRCCSCTGKQCPSKLWQGTEGTEGGDKYSHRQPLNLLTVSPIG